MATLKDIYAILRDMLKYAEQKNKNEVLAHHDFFEGMWQEVDWPNRALYLLYDTCRQSCVMAIQQPFNYDNFIVDARERFAKIPKP